MKNLHRTVLSGSLVPLFCIMCQAPATADEKKGDLYILSIGIEPKLTATGKRDPYAKDAEFIDKALATAKPHYRAIQNKVVNGEQATRNNVLRELGALGKKMRADDVAVIFFSTHGGFDPKTGYSISLAGSHKRNGGDQVLRGDELHQAVGAIRGRVIVLLDTCAAGGAIPAKATTLKNAAFVVACGKNQESSGQWEHKDRPHGFFVIAVCEALQGQADKNKDGVVTLKELEDYLPARASELNKEQTAVLRRQTGCEDIPLAKVEAGVAMKKLYSPAAARNPFGVPDVEKPFANDVRDFAQQARLPGGPKDVNAQLWNTRTYSGKKDSLEGTWQSRWNSDAARTDWHEGVAQIKLVEDRVYILFRDGGGRYFIEARRAPNERLVGRYVNLNDSSDTSPWVGRIVDHERIDGVWSNGRWDFRRKLPDK